MFRVSLLSSLRTASRAVSARPVAAVGAKFTPMQFQIPNFRLYSAAAALTKADIESRIVGILKNFEKVSDASKITGTANFASDLGLDSLDTVEVVMAIEEEFSIEIPDKEADAIQSVSQAVEYIASQPDAH